MKVKSFSCETFSTSTLLSGQAKEYKGNQKHKPGCPKGKLASKLVSNTADNAILAFWLVHCISVTSHYTCIWPYMEINAANVILFVRSQVLSTKKWMRKETNSASFLQKKLRTMPPRNNEKAIVQNENIQRYVSVKVPVKSCKISNISKYEQWDFTPL